MDAKQFDELLARLAQGPSRRDALKGAIGGALTAITVAAAMDDGAEAKKKNKKKKKTICHCPDGNPDNCQTLRLKKKAAKKHLKKHPNDFAGACPATTTTTAAPTTTTTAAPTTTTTAAPTTTTTT